MFIPNALSRAGSTLIENQYVQAVAAFRGRMISAFQNPYVAGVTLFFIAYLASKKTHEFSEMIVERASSLIDKCIDESDHKEMFKRIIIFTCWSSLLIGISSGVSRVLSLPLSQSCTIAIIGWTTFGKSYIHAD